MSLTDGYVLLICLISSFPPLSYLHGSRYYIFSPFSYFYGSRYYSNNSHFSVMFRPQGELCAIYTLPTPLYTLTAEVIMMLVMHLPFLKYYMFNNKVDYCDRVLDINHMIYLTNLFFLSKCHTRYDC